MSKHLSGHKPQGRVVVAAAATASMFLAIGAPVAVVSPGGVAFAADTALIMGGTGLPNPPQSYVDAVDNLYLIPNGYSTYTPQALDTPEQGYPLTGVNSLPIDTSIAQGTTILDDAIKTQLAAGNHVVVFGYSQSSLIASQEAAQLASSSNPPSPSQLSFVLVGDESNPNGGLLTRFEVPGAPLSLPSLGTTFNEVPTAGSPYPTAVYTQEYDGFADFPQYPINVLSDLNAYLGIFTQHFGYVDLTPQQISSAIALPTTGNTTTRYYMIPTANLPLLAPVRLIPLIGDPLADLLQPDLAVLVNLGYGSITNGWSPGPANVATPFSLFPTNVNLSDLVTALADGAVQGVTNALNDLKTPTLFDFSPLSEFLAGFNTAGLTPSTTPSLLQVLAGFATLGNADVPVSSNGGVVNTLTSVIANDLAVAKPLGDTALAIAGSLPQYDAQLLTSQLQAGNLLNAVGMPIAADVALSLYALIVGAAFPIVGAAATTVTQLAELTGLEPNPTPAAAPATTASTTNTNAQPALSTNAGANAANAPNGGTGAKGGADNRLRTAAESAGTSGAGGAGSAAGTVTGPGTTGTAGTTRPAGTPGSPGESPLTASTVRAPTAAVNTAATTAPNLLTPSATTNSGNKVVTGQVGGGGTAAGGQVSSILTKLGAGLTGGSANLPKHGK